MVLKCLPDTTMCMLLILLFFPWAFFSLSISIIQSVQTERGIMPCNKPSVPGFFYTQKKISAMLCLHDSSEIKAWRVRCRIATFFTIQRQFTMHLFLIWWFLDTILHLNEHERWIFLVVHAQASLIFPHLKELNSVILGFPVVKHCQFFNVSYKKKCTFSKFIQLSWCLMLITDRNHKK